MTMLRKQHRSELSRMCWIYWALNLHGHS